MSYYPTLAEDVQRAKEILARGKAEFDEKLGDILPGLADEHLVQIKNLVGGTIYGGDIYAAYRLLESFVEAIEVIGVDVVKTALRAQALARSHADAAVVAQANDETAWESPVTVPAAPSITCPRCGATSHNPNDIRERYCGRCHRFQDETAP